MLADIKKCRLQGNTVAPPSKSYLHRLLICAALAEGTSRITNVSDSEDIRASIDCIEALGACVERQGDALMVTGNGSKPVVEADFACRESGSTLRFFIPIAGALCRKASFTGAERLLERGIGIYESILPGKGVDISAYDGKIILTGGLQSGDITIPGNVSSQYVTGLLFALPLVSGDSTLTVTEPFESRAYVDITIGALQKAGIVIERKDDNVFFVRGGQKYGTIDERTEGDWSNAAFLYALKGLGHNIEVSGLSGESLQGDRICTDHFDRLDRGCATLDISGCIDLGPILFAYAAARKGGVFTGTKRLKIKESDRANAMASELRKFGTEVDVTDDTVTVSGGIQTPVQTLDGHNDHRIVMALTVLLTLTGGVIDGVEAVRKSFPDFFDVLGRLGLNVEIR